MALLTAVYMGVFDKASTSRFGQFVKGLSFIVLIYAFALALGTFMGTSNYLQPLKFLRPNTIEVTNETGLSWQKVTNLSELQNALQQAQIRQKPVIVDFYADWCISCKDMVNHVFTQPEVIKLLNQFVLVRADVTNNTEDEIALTKHFHVIAPPTFLFFNQDGTEINTRIDGEESVPEFAQVLSQVLSHLQLPS